jgi:hypothetical protein
MTQSEPAADVVGDMVDVNEPKGDATTQIEAKIPLKHLFGSGCFGQQLSRLLDL